MIIRVTENVYPAVCRDDTVNSDSSKNYNSEVIDSKLGKKVFSKQYSKNLIYGYYHHRRYFSMLKFLIIILYSY